MTSTTRSDPRAREATVGGRGSGVRITLVVGGAGLATGLAVLDLAGAVGPAGWAAGAGCATLLGILLGRGLHRAGRETLLPADLVTLTRALLACAVAAQTADALPGTPSAAALLALTVPALALDAADGQVARRTGTATRFGARFDGEVDAFLILVLSLAAGSAVGWWLLAGGLARYVFGAWGAALPWLRRPLPSRYWRKVVTGTVGVGLAALAAGLPPRRFAVAGGAFLLLLLAESFGRDVWWLWRNRPLSSPARGRPGRRRAVVRVALVGAALLPGWFALLAPVRPERLSALSFLRLPVEALVVLGLAVVLPPRARRGGMVLVGAGLGTLALAKVLDLGMMQVRDRPFDVVDDVGAVGSAFAVVRDSFGTVAAAGAVLGALLVVAAALVGLPWALARAGRGVAQHRRPAARVLGGLTVAWALAAAGGVQSSPGVTVAAADVVPYAASTVQAARAHLRDRARFAAAVAADPFRAPGSADLSVLRGMDVLVVFVESYGRVAVDGPRAEPLRRLLGGYASRLAAEGYTARSAYLTSPVVGSGSWLAHSTLEAGLRVGDQGLYDRLLGSRRTTLTSAFARAGWRTVAVLPSTRGPWPEGQAFYRFDRVYTGADLGYQGPSFGFSAMPDQYTLAALDHLELDRPHHQPVMAEVELTSSHWPWAPLPTTVDPAALGRGAVFRGIRATARSAAELWNDRADVPAAYRTSIAYSLSSVLSFVAGHRDDDLVVLVLGDHQPSTVVTGPGAGRDVPVTLIARDPAVLERASRWCWNDGLWPGAAAPVWPMEALRDRFLSSFSAPAAS